MESPGETASMKRLALMALDVLSPAPMSDEPERIFSSAGNTQGKRRTALDPVTLEAIEQMKSWDRAGLASFIESKDSNDVTLKTY